MGTDILGRCHAASPHQSVVRLAQSIDLPFGIGPTRRGGVRHCVGGNSMRLVLSLFAFLAVAVFGTVGWSQHHSYNLPPANRLMEPGPGVGGPGPGVLPPIVPALPQMAIPVSQPTVQVLFSKPEGMHVQWDTSGQLTFDAEPVVVPVRQNFAQGGIYQLKISHIEGRPALELYPTLEVGPITPRTEAYLAHNALPVQFTQEDLDQVAAGNFVTKVIYLPDPEFQEMALAGVETLVSTRLDPGVDPIIEADRRGSIMAVVRVGNKNIELEGQAGAAAMAGAGGTGMAVPAGYAACGPGGAGLPAGFPPNYVAGVTAPQYGMPYTGTPIGLVGPPHIPLGAPAGLQKHVMRNHTAMNIPQPTSKFKVHVRQQPGMSYPKPPSRMSIREQTIYPPMRYGQPYYDKLQPVR